jgi:hypothetical protein
MKRSLTLALLCLVAATPLAVAQGQVCVPDNVPTTGGTNVYPFGYQQEWRYQLLVDASGLPSAPFKITDMAVNARTTTIFTAPQLQIRMCNVTLSSFQAAADRNFDSNLCPCPTQVYNGPITINATSGIWTNLGLQCSHAYDGRRNLLIEIRYRATSQQGLRQASTTVASAVRRLWRFGTGSYTATTGGVDSTSVSGAPKLCFTIDRTCVALAPDTVQLGNSFGISVQQAPAGALYQMAASFGQGPPIYLGSYRLCLAVDPLFFASLFGGPPTFNAYSGAVGAGGSFGAKMLVPPIKALVGVCVHHAAVVFDKGGIRCCTNTVGTEIIP